MAQVPAGSLDEHLNDKCLMEWEAVLGFCASPSQAQHRAGHEADIR